MSIPSITIRLDFDGSGGVVGTETQGSAPAPVDISTLGVAAQGGGVPNPTDIPALANVSQAPPPTPVAEQIGSGTAGVGSPPEPSADVPGLGGEIGAGSSDAAEGGEDVPEPVDIPDDGEAGSESGNRSRTGRAKKA